MAQPTLGVTLVDTNERVSPGRARPDALDPTDVAARYAPLSRLGEGGMGEVWLLRDGVIGRDIAMKSMRPALETTALARERFLREARVQGQLEHPSIVPVHDLGLAADGRLYFTMQRVRGKSLYDRVYEAPANFGRHAALAAMSRVCLTVDFAHAHGVVHRDIKPANIMIGDFGEVYLLDWGLARLKGHDDLDGPVGEPPPSSRLADGTTFGSVLGTPGYMPPEQARGEPVDERADVYALGACLFEVLARQPLHRGETVAALLASTEKGADARISVRAPDLDVPLELEAICVRATATRPADRFPTARAVHEAIERFLEGDRDLTRRKARSAEHARAARGLADRAIRESDPRARAEAMREVGRALALDPGNAEAMGEMVRLLTDPPTRPPPEVESRLEASRERSAVEARGYSAVTMGTMLLPLVLCAWMGLRNGWPLVVSAAAALVGSVMTGLPTRRWQIRRTLVAILGATAIASASRLAGPFVVTPVMAMGLAVGLTVFPRSQPVWAAIAVGWSAVLAPLGLELAGVISPSYEFLGDRLSVAANLVAFPRVPTLVYLTVVTLLPIAAVCTYAGRMRDRLTAAEERLRIQAWQLRQILPEAEEAPPSVMG